MYAIFLESVFLDFLLVFVPELVGFFALTKVVSVGADVLNRRDFTLLKNLENVDNSKYGANNTCLSDSVGTVLMENTNYNTGQSRVVENTNKSNKTSNGYSNAHLTQKQRERRRQYKIRKGDV